MRWKLFLFDIVGFMTTTTVFLVVNPSEHGRLRLIYIALQVLLCTLIVFLSRLCFKVYKKPVDTFDLATHDDILVLLSDLTAGIVIYLIQLLIPDILSIRISFVQIACIMGINLLIAAYGRKLFRAILLFCKHYSDQMVDS